MSNPRFIPYGTKPTAGRHRALSVLDAFSAECFKNDLTLYPVEPGEPAVALDYLQPELFLVESAWNGNQASWRHALTGSNAPSRQLRSLVEQCRDRGIPTVFWNKEDPPHFSEFLETAKLFDRIYTTEESLIAKYRESAPEAEVDVLRFAASPAIHTPLRTESYRQRSVGFAGQYFTHKFPERRAQMDYLFAAASGHGLEIYSRALGGKGEYQFPAQYANAIVGSLPYPAMVEAYRDYKVFINVNSVPKSRSMCARRIFELASCKTVVLTPPSHAITTIFADDEIAIAEDRRQAEELLSHLLSDTRARREIAQRAWRRVASSHTYSDRVDQIACGIGMPTSEEPPTVSVLCRAESQSELDFALDSLIRQSIVRSNTARVRLIALADPATVVARSKSSVEVVVASSLSETARAIRGVWGPWSPRLRRGMYYLEDLLLYLRRYTMVDTVGKIGTFDTLSLDESETAEESVGHRVLSCAWLTTSTPDVFGDLALAVDGDESVVSLDRPLYRADSFNVGLGHTSWEA